MKTPLTDTEEYSVWSEGNQGLGDEYAEKVVSSDFARKLERDRAELLDALKCILHSSEYEAKSIAEEYLADFQ